MVKKIAKIALVLLIVIGAVVSISNMVDTELQAVEFPEVKYLRDVPDCKGEGKGCIDMTNPG